jgi:hypothetical protein
VLFRSESVALWLASTLGSIVVATEYEPETVPY